MKATERELAAAHRLGEAVLEFVLAYEAAVEERHPVVEKRHPVAVVQVEEKPKSGAQAIHERSAAEARARGLLSTREASEYLSIGERKLWEITAPRGAVPAVRIGKLVRYRMSDLEDFAQRSMSRRRGQM